MRVLFLDDDLTRARIIKGLFRKLQTEVHRSRNYWHYSKSGEYVGGWLDSSLDDARARERKSRATKVDWTPVASGLPEARVHGRNG